MRKHFQANQKKLLHFIFSCGIISRVILIKCVDEVGVLANFDTENTAYAESGNKIQEKPFPSEQVL